jgi:hypothetical protein
MMKPYARPTTVFVLFAAGLAAQDFARDVRPVIEKNCVGCHNPQLRLSGLSLASREHATTGGRRGPAVQSAQPEQSLLLKAIRHEGNLRMPPGRKLAQADIAMLEKWVRSGAPWPADIATAGARPNHWSFLPPLRLALPAARASRWVRSPVDRFILARLEKEGIQPSPEAAKPTLIRRLYLDLVGLLPPPEEVKAFAQGRLTYEQLVDKLLASPHFGERWGRRWLDYARYADSDGGSRDEPRQIWRYRDWVIDAFHRDMPFDRFVIEQLAGDLLESPTASQLTATGFHRNSPIQIEAGTDREQYRTDAVFDRVDVTGTVFLGLSVGCAKCHDHKYDPISQKEYYRLYAFFNSSDDWSEDRPRYNPAFDNLHQVHGPLLEFASPETVRQRDELTAAMMKLDEDSDRLRELKTPEAREELKRRTAEIAKLRKQLPRIESTMIMRELPQPRETHVLKGGDYLAKGERVTPGVPAFLHPFPEKPNANRLDFAKWLVDPANPLLARVTVNRIWQEYFGRGLVETENDFGTQGAPPTHPELLDWLATEFIRSGWSQKAIHRAIVTSAAYRQASRVRPELAERDPRNLLLARQTRLRLDAEIVRDAALCASGLLVAKAGGPSVFPPQPAAAMSASQLKKTWTASTGDDRYRRGMYTFFWRVTPNPSLIVFDAPSGMTACTRRTRSNTPLQALALLNETAFHEFARGFAERLLRETAGKGFEDRLGRAFELALSRPPSARERERLRTLYATERDALQTQPEDVQALAGSGDIELAAWVSLSRVLMNTDEFMTRE